MMNKNGKNFKNNSSTSKLSFLFIMILFLCFNQISPDNIGGSLMSLASPSSSNSAALFVNPIQNKINQKNALNKLINKNGNFSFLLSLSLYFIILILSLENAKLLKKNLETNIKANKPVIIIIIIKSLFDIFNIK